MKNFLLFLSFLSFCVLAQAQQQSYLQPDVAYLHYPTDSSIVIDILANDEIVGSPAITFTQPQNGTVTLLPNGKVRYVANSMAVVPYSDAFMYTVGGDYYAANVQIYPQYDGGVMPNVPPYIGITPTREICSNVLTATFVGVWAYDLNNDALIYSISHAPEHGTASLVDNYGNIYYQPETNYTGTDYIEYQVCEIGTPDLFCSEGVIEIIVQDCIEEPLQANADYIYVQDGQPTNIVVLANDFADYLPVTLSITTQGLWGTASVNPDNTVTYTPNANISGVTDELTYSLCDTQNNCVEASISVQLGTSGAVICQPQNEQLYTRVNEPLHIDFFANDYGNTEGATVSVFNTQPVYGTLEQQADGTYIYTSLPNLAKPENSFYVSDTFFHIDCLPNGECYESSTTITIYFYIANSEYHVVPYQTPDAFSVLDNDYYAENVTLSQILVSPQHGTAYITPNQQQIIYIPNNLFLGNDELYYVACTPAGDCDTARVLINVTEPQTADNIPVPVQYKDLSFCRESMQDGMYFIWNDFYQANETYSINITQAPQNGTASVGDNKLYYTPSPSLTLEDYPYSDTLYYNICETNTPELYCTESRLVVTVVDCSPSQVDAQNAYISFGQLSFPSVTFPLTTFADYWETLTYTQISTPNYGTIQISSNGEVTYAMNDNIEAEIQDSIQYAVCNSIGVCDTAYVLVYALGYQCCHLSNDDFFETYSSIPDTLYVLANDAPNTQITGIAAQPQYGTISFTDTTLVYTPYGYAYGQDNFSYIACLEGICDTALVLVNNYPNTDIGTTNYMPDGGNQTINTCEEDGTGFNIVMYDLNPNDTLSLIFTQMPLHGTIDTIGNQITYIPTNDYFGVDTLRYTICETNTPDLYCRDAFVAFNVINCTPDFYTTYDSYYIAGDSSTTTILDVLTNDHDEYGLPLTITIDSLPIMGTVTVNPDNTLSYTFNGNTIASNNYGQSDYLSYVVCNTAGICDTENVYLNVYMTYDTQLQEDTVYVLMNQARTLDLLANDSPNAVLQSVYTQYLNGTVVVNDDNTITYTPNADYTGYDYFSYTACEPYHHCASKEVFVTVIKPEDNFVPTVIARDDYVNDPIFENNGRINVLQNDTYFTGMSYAERYVTIVENPMHGTVDVTYDTNEVIYARNPPFEQQPDSFKYAVCTLIGDVFAENPITMCDTATVYVLEYCANNCVWPGDVNNDQTVNTLDLLALGIAAEGSGSPRTSPSEMWIGQNGDLWDDYFVYQPFGTTKLINKKYADCNGDSTITTADVASIATNYGKNHLSQQESDTTFIPIKPNAPLIRLDLPTEITPGTRHFADVYLATEDLPATDVYGVAFTLEFPEAQIPADSLILTYTDSWLGSPDQLISLTHTESSEAHIALSRRDWQGMAGYGKIATLSYYVANNTQPTPEDQTLNLRIRKPYYSDSYGHIERLASQTTSSLVMPVVIDGIAPTYPQTATGILKVYPNPTHNQIRLKTNNEPLRYVTVLDMTGRIVYEVNLNETNQTETIISLGQLPSGIYIVQAQTTRQVLTQKVVLKK